MEVAVVGHVELVTFARLERLPLGEDIHASDWWDLLVCSGAVAAVQLTKLANGAAFYSALGDDDAGHWAFEEISRSAHARRLPSERVTTRC